MDISLAGYDLIVFWKTLPNTAKFYTDFFLAAVGYATYSLARVSVGLGRLREKAALEHLERRIANVRQIILLALLLLGVTAAELALAWVRARPWQFQCGDCIDASGLWAEFVVAVLVALVFLHAFQWIASVWLCRRASSFPG
jgi:hypothetical protein